jgi:hypothetical protein
MAADLFNRMTGRTGPLPDGVPFGKLFSLDHIDTRIQKHLQQVRARKWLRGSSARKRQGQTHARAGGRLERAAGAALAHG